MANIEGLLKKALPTKRRFLVTGAAGFIGSHLTEWLLRMEQEVYAVDTFITGSKANLDDVCARVGAAAWENFTFFEGSVADAELMTKACAGVDIVLHQAALGSVPRSIEYPLASNEANVTGFLTMLVAAKDAQVSRVVYASSSSVYGDDTRGTKTEDCTGNVLSPYAVTKKVNELYGAVISSLFPITTVGLRYFNVFGPRQDPNGQYAAVIPKWVDELITGTKSTINGDGSTSRDFTYVDNVVLANILAATAPLGESPFYVMNIACGAATSLTELYKLIRDALAKDRPQVAASEPHYGPFRKGDIKHSLAEIGRAQELLGFNPLVTVDEGIAMTVAWYLAQRG